MGCVYLVGDWDKEHRYKIGVTRGDVYNRIKKLQTGNSGEIYLVDKFETEHPFVMEKMLHQWYHDSKALGEWFELDDEEVKTFRANCEKIKGIIESLKDNYYFNATTTKKRRSKGKEDKGKTR